MAVSVSLLPLTLISVLETVVHFKPCPIAHLSIELSLEYVLIFFARKGNSLVSGIEKSHDLYSVG